MIDLYMWPTGNGKKISIMLEECELPYEAFPVNITKGDQNSPEFHRISPNSKIPAIIDYDGNDSPICLFESGAILQYLAEKTGRFLPQYIRGKYQVLQWLNWQIGGLGPMGGQAHHFLRFATEKIEYAMMRYKNEVSRLYGVLDQQLTDSEFIAGEYSIADIAIWPWIARYEWQQQKLEDFPQVKRWYSCIGKRPAVQRAMEVGKTWMDDAVQMDEKIRQRIASITMQDLR